ncbi:MAG TPA: FAD-dependent oxidoreductase [Bryobacteraceae bacterium]|nr:FAD-dependent oxidoreductase [Bryobacteraceae bacterium]
MNEPRYEHLVFAGNGMSGVACVEELIKSGQIFDITIFGDEPHANYDRTLLSSVLAGERDIESITLNDIEWYQEHGIRTRLGIRVEEIDRLNRAVRSSDGDWTSYDKLIIATGSSPMTPPIEGLDKIGVFVFGTFDDTRKLVEASGPGVRAVVIGGWLAADAARGLRKRGCDVVIVDPQSSSEWQLDTVLGERRVEAVRFTSGEEIGADLVVIATKLQPNTLLARNAGLEVNRGIVVNDQLETSDRNIFSIGGCTEHHGQTFDCFPPLLAQAKVLAANLADGRRSAFTKLDAVFQELTLSPLHQRAE